MYRIYILICLGFVSLYAQNEPLETNLSQKNYRGAYEKCMYLKKKARTANEHFYWRYYYIKIALGWNKEKEFNESKISYHKYKAVMKELMENAGFETQKTEIKKLHKRYFYPLKVVIKSYIQNVRENENPVGYFGFRIISAGQSDLSLTPLQKERLAYLSHFDRIQKKNFKEIEFKFYRSSYFYSELEDIPLLQADNPNLGYVIQYEYENAPKRYETEKVPFSLGTKENRRVAILKEIKTNSLAIKTQYNSVLIYFTNGISNINVRNAKIINNYNKDGYLHLKVKNNDKVTIELKEMGKSKISNVWTIAIGIMGVITFILAR